VPAGFDLDQKDRPTLLVRVRNAATGNPRTAVATSAVSGAALSRYVEFIAAREQARSLTRAAAATSAPAFVVVSNNRRL
jgi:hypothetical protein